MNLFNYSDSGFVESSVNNDFRKLRLVILLKSPDVILVLWAKSIAHVAEAIQSRLFGVSRRHIDKYVQFEFHGID